MLEKIINTPKIICFTHVKVFKLNAETYAKNCIHKINVIKKRQ